MYSNLEIEQTILGTIIMDSKRLDHVVDLLKDYHFSDKAHQVIYEEILDIAREGEVNELILKTFFNNNPVFENKGLSYLSQLITKTTVILNIRVLTKELVELWQKRELINIAQQSVDLLRDKKFSYAISQLENSIAGIVCDAEKKNIQSLDQIINDIDNEVITNEFVETGFKKLDEMLNGGFYNQQLIVIGARPSVGKTSLAQNIMLNVAKQGKRCLFVSLEISKKNAIFKFLTLATEVPLWKIQKKIGIDNQSYIEKKQHLANLPIYIDDSSQLTVSQIKQVIKRQFDLTGLDLVVVDYIQIVKGENTFNKNEASIIKDITSTLKGLSKQFNIPILALAQINRKGAENSEQEPTMNDFKGSGGIEEDSDVAMILHRAKNSNNDLQYLSNAGQLIIAKNRYGQTGKIGINFNGEIGKFTEDNNDTF